MTLIVKRHNNSVKLIGPLVCALICFTTMIWLFNSMSHAMLWDGWLLLLVRILLFSWAVGMVLELLLEGVVNPHVVSAYLMAIGYNNWQKEQGKICFLSINIVVGLRNLQWSWCVTALYLKLVGPLAHLWIHLPQGCSDVDMWATSSCRLVAIGESLLFSGRWVWWLVI